jgi:hypothetical protein
LAPAPEPFLGFGWYKLLGCSTGTCPLTSHPVTSTILGALLGTLLATVFAESKSHKLHENAYAHPPVRRHVHLS